MSLLMIAQTTQELILTALLAILQIPIIVQVLYAKVA